MRALRHAGVNGPMTAVWFVVLALCVLGTSYASRQAVTAALRIVDGLSVSPAVVGLTVLAIGTDLPEIANSIVSVAAGHGDVNVGNASGSTLTQVTLTLGLLAIVGTITVNRNFVVSIGTATFFAAVVVWVFVQDGELSRTDGLVLILLWFGGTLLLSQAERRGREPLPIERGRVGTDVLITLFWLAVVGVLAIGMVESFLEITEAFGLPEFIASFVALAFGTSLPELFVDFNAIRRGASAMAVGDLFGSSFVDSTLSVGIGPAIFSSIVSDDVLLGTALAALGVAVATVVVARVREVDWKIGLVLIAVYVTIQVVATVGT